MFRTLYPHTGHAVRNARPPARPPSAAMADDGVERLSVGKRVALFAGAGIAGLGLDIVV